MSFRHRRLWEMVLIACIGYSIPNDLISVSHGYENIFIVDRGLARLW